MTGLPARLASVGVAVLAAVALLLTGLALSHRGAVRPPTGPADAVGPAPDSAAVATAPGSTAVATAPGSAAGAPDAAGSPTPSPSALPTAGGGGVELVLAGTAVVRATGVGSCTASPGVHWDGTAVRLPAGHLLRLRGDGADHALAVLGTGPECARVRAFTTDDDGATWTPESPPERTWFVARGAVHTPSGGLAAGACASTGTSVDELAVSGPAVATARCGSDLRRTRDGGRTWTAVPSPEGQLRAVAAQGQQLLAAVTGATDCPGVAVERLDAGSWTTRGCARVPDGVGPAAVVALAAAGRRLALDAGGLQVSTDGGATWAAA